MAILEVDDVYRFYHTGEIETRALRGVSLLLNQGEMVAVQGPSGSGKSTLLACIAGLDVPDGGSVVLMGTSISRKSETVRATLRSRYMGILLQTGNLFPHLTVEENIMLQMHLCEQTGKNGWNPESRVTELLGFVGLEHRGTARPMHISGGENARAALAVALSVEPYLLIADEPTGEVDGETEEAILRLLEKFTDNGGSVLVATHSNVVAAFAARTVELQDGRIVNNE